MPMAAMEPRRFRKTAIPRTASIKRLLREPLARCTLRMAARLMASPVSMAIALPRVRLQMATSMRPRTATSTATPAAVGVRRTETPTIRINQAVRVIQTTPRDPTHQAGEDRKRAAGVGDPGQRARVVRQAAAVVVAGKPVPLQSDQA